MRALMNLGAKSLMLAAVFAAPGAFASSMRYVLDHSNALSSVQPYASVTLSEVNDDIQIVVDIIDSAFSVSGNNFGLQSFSFNYSNQLSVSKNNIVQLNLSDWKITEDKNAGGDFGKFDFQFKGNGNSRAEVLSFTIADVEGDTIADYAVGYTEQSIQFFAAHIAGFDPIEGVTSAQFAGSTPQPVPLPATAWLLLVALVPFASRLRRSKP